MTTISVDDIKSLIDEVATERVKDYVDFVNCDYDDNRIYINMKDCFTSFSICFSEDGKEHKADKGDGSIYLLLGEESTMDSIKKFFEDVLGDYDEFLEEQGVSNKED